MAKTRATVADPLEAAKVGGITPTSDPLDALDQVDADITTNVPPPPIAAAPVRVQPYRLKADVRVHVNGQITTLRAGRVVSDACGPSYMQALHEAKAQLEPIAE
jgi:hypothetical protein